MGVLSDVDGVGVAVVGRVPWEVHQEEGRQGGRPVWLGGWLSTMGRFPVGWSTVGRSTVGWAALGWSPIPRAAIGGTSRKRSPVGWGAVERSIIRLCTVGECALWEVSVMGPVVRRGAVGSAGVRFPCLHPFGACPVRASTGGIGVRGVG